MNIQKSKSLRISIIISLIIHSIAFSTFAWIKFNVEKKTETAIPVSFVKEKQTNLLRRSSPVRQLILYNQSSQRYSPEQPTYISTNYGLSPDFHTNLYSDISSEVGILEYESLQAIKPLYSGFQHHKNMSMTVSLGGFRSRPVQVYRNVSSGYKLISHNSLESMTPKEWLTPDLSGILQSFFGSIRKKIESKKKYPELAKDAGIEGRSGVKMIILKDGQLEKVEIVDSSGNQLLDNAAVQSILKAAPFPPIPKDVKQSKIEVSIYLVFKIART
ncbi:MAG: periplasmic protein TonB [Candidatus Poribacteria bacterium]|nr:periplasmic protein TonB [Candidatus Poribacteria bacterium]